MKKSISICCFIFITTVLLSGCVPKMPDDISAGSNIADTGFISVNDLKKSLPDIVYNSVDDNFFAFWAAAPGDDSTSTDNYILGRKISSAGIIEGDTIIIHSGPAVTIMPKALHIPHMNQFILIYGSQEGRMNIHGRILNADGKPVGLPFRVTDVPANQFHYTFAYNSNRHEFFVTYNDSRNGAGDIFGVILNEDGTIAIPEFVINNSTGHQVNPVVSYNSTDDNYLLNWEDFRVHGDIPVLQTLEVMTNIRGALFDWDGSMLLNDIPMCVDHLTVDADQRFNNISYNPNTNQYLVSWSESGSSLLNAGIVGRIVNADGLMPAEAFVLVDEAGAQMIGHTDYLAEHNKYYIAFEKDDNDLDLFYFKDITANLDIGARWLGSDGLPEGSMIDIFSGSENQRFVRFAHSTASDTLLLIWQNDFPGQSDDWFGHIMTAGGDIAGALITIP